jgi:hypothetical protein
MTSRNATPAGKTKHIASVRFLTNRDSGCHPRDVVGILISEKDLVIALWRMSSLAARLLGPRGREADKAFQCAHWGD